MSAVYHSAPYGANTYTKSSFPTPHTVTAPSASTSLNMDEANHSFSSQSSHKSVASLLSNHSANSLSNYKTGSGPFSSSQLPAYIMPPITIPMDHIHTLGDSRSEFQSQAQDAHDHHPSSQPPQLSQLAQAPPARPVPVPPTQQQQSSVHDRPQPLQPQLVHQPSEGQLSQSHHHGRGLSQTAFTPVAAANVRPPSDEAPKRTGLETHSMTLPACISPEGGRLADFVAQMACFMIQEPWKTISEACNYTPGSPLPRRLVPEAVANEELLKWTNNILSTTQVTQNVVLLALLLIYRLKRGHQHLKGHYGSAYRLLTVALMLGNKFLDDNTYTNKTWAEVSYIRVTEIHSMEVEFLSNLRYSLFVREQQWSAWLKNMANMKAYYDEAARRISSPDPSSLVSLSQPQPQTHMTQNVYAHASHSPSRLSTTYTVNAAGQTSHPCNYHDLSPSLSVSSRKRGYIDVTSTAEDDAPRKRRISRADSPSDSAIGALHSRASREHRKLALPTLTVNTEQPFVGGADQTQNAPYIPPAIAAPPAVTSNPGGSSTYRSLVSRPALPQPVFPVDLPYSAGTSVANSATGQAATPTFLPVSTAGSHLPPSIGYMTPTKRHSPHTAVDFYPSYPAPRSPLSPAVQSAGIHRSGGATRTMPAVSTPLDQGYHRSPFNLSPINYLDNRSSPYRPVRTVHTLLHPAGGGIGNSLEGYHLTGQPITPSAMQYHRIGRPQDIQSGVVPDYRGY